MSKIAFMFPGQASQEVGMGKKITERFKVAKDTFDEADDNLDGSLSLSKKCFEGAIEVFEDTRVTQLGGYVTNIAIMRAFQSETGITPDFVVGHSVGEFACLPASGASDFVRTLELVQERAALTHETSLRTPGGMAAIINTAIERVKEICDQTGTSIANYNTPTQLVISGKDAAIDKAVELFKKGRTNSSEIIKKLPITIAAHTDIQNSVAMRLTQRFRRTEFEDPSIPIVVNHTGKIIRSVSEIREHIPVGLRSQVLWWDCIQTLLRNNVTIIYEVGSKKVLTKMLEPHIDSNMVQLRHAETELLKVA